MAMKILGGLILLIVVAIGGLYLYGMMLPEQHHASVTAEFKTVRPEVWKVISDFPRLPEWWSDVKSVEIEARPGGMDVTWNMDKHGERIGFVTMESIPDQRLLRKIVDDGLPFGGTWLFELQDLEGGGTFLTLTEDGFVKPPFFRAVMKLFVGETATMKSFVKALHARVP